MNHRYPYELEGYKRNYLIASNPKADTSAKKVAVGVMRRLEDMYPQVEWSVVIDLLPISSDMLEVYKVCQQLTESCVDEEKKVRFKMTISDLQAVYPGIGDVVLKYQAVDL